MVRVDVRVLSGSWFIGFVVLVALSVLGCGLGFARFVGSVGFLISVLGCALFACFRHFRGVAAGCMLTGVERQ